MRAAIFVDGNYLEKVIDSEFRARVDYKKLASVIIPNPTEILRTYYYNSLPYLSVTPTEEENNRYLGKQRFYGFLSRLNRFEVREGRCVKRGKMYEQKGIDTLLSIDLVNLAATNKITDAILIAGDYDFVPAVKAIRSMGVVVTLYHSQMRESYHQQLWELYDERIPMTRFFVEMIQSRP